MSMNKNCENLFSIVTLTKLCIEVSSFKEKIYKYFMKKSCENRQIQKCQSSVFNQGIVQNRSKL